MRLSNDDMERLVSYLEGTCKSLWEASNELFEHDIEEYENELEICNFIDERIFLCRECNWWYEVGYWNPEGFEEGNSEVCLDCMPEEND